MRGTIKSSDQISAIFSEGKRLNTAAIGLIVSNRQHGQDGRAAFIAGKKNGNAVWRNAAKRRMRAICHELGGPWPGLDVLFLAKRQTTKLSYSKVLDATRKALEPYIEAEKR